MDAEDEREVREMLMDSSEDEWHNATEGSISVSVVG